MGIPPAFGHGQDGHATWGNAASSPAVKTQTRSRPPTSGVSSTVATS